jgi:hypothetical protein
MDRPHRESHQHNGITLRRLSQLTFATKSAQSGRSYANGISWSITSELKTIQFPTGKEIAKPCQSVRRGQGARQGAFVEYWIWNENTPFRLN